MKFKNKILLNILVIIVLIFFIKNVSAVGNISQAWIENSAGQRELVFRNYTSPYSSTLANYDNTVKNNSSYSEVENGNWKYVNANGKSYTSRWVDTRNSVGISLPNGESFRTMGFAFHSSPLNTYPTYTKKSGSTVGYTNSSELITSGIQSIEKIYNYSEAVYTVPSNNSGSPQFTNNVFYTVWKSKASFQNINWGTGLKATGFTANENTDLRYCIVNIGGSNVYVEDHVIHANSLTQLLEAYSENQQVEKNQNFCYISDVIVSKSYNKDYEVAYTAKNFFSQYNKQGYSANFWGANTRGFGDKAMGSVLNLYDNKIYFPQMSTREVYVRHINIGNNTIINKSIVDNAERIRWARNPELFLLNGKVINGDHSKEYSYQEYFNGVPIEEGFNLYALPNTTTYRCLGYNIGIGSSLTQAQNAVDGLIDAGAYTKGDTASVSGKSITASSDVIVIDFYYTEYEKNVYVNHVYVDKDNVVKEIERQTIIPNEYALEDGATTINRINDDKYIKEEYKKRMSHSVQVRVSDYLKNLETDSNGNEVKIEYRGYEILDKQTDISSIIGKQMLKLKDNNILDLEKAKAVNISESNEVQVNFYYYYENRVEEEEPAKDIGGQVFVTNTNPVELNTECPDDETTKSVYSIPSGINATVGIKGIPRYMVAAITTHYESPKELKDINMKISYKYGKETKTITFPTLYYKVGYFTVTDMAMYKLENMTIYDAENNQGMQTSGSKLFNWENSKLSLKPNNINLTVEMKGINNTKIDNENITNIDNYVRIVLKDIYNLNLEIKPSLASGVSITANVLTTNQISKVDADGNNIIDENDKIFATNKINELKSVLDQKESIMSGKKDVYEAQVKELNRLQSVYNETETKLNNKEKAKNDSLDRLHIYEESYTRFKEDYADGEEQKLAKLEQELKELKELKDTKNEELEVLQQVLSQQETKKTNLFNEIESLKQQREVLKQAANCIDTVEEQVYIYLEQDEKDKLEECKTNKLLYDQNIEEGLLEIREEEYNNFLNNEYSTAVTNKSNKEYEIEELEKDIKNKESEISTQTLVTLAARTMLHTLYNQKENYRENVYLVLKSEYDSYNENEYTTAKNEYDDFVNNQYVEKAKVELDEATKEYEKAKEPYDTYYSYKQTLESLYDDYKAKYDIYTGINVNSGAESVARYLDLKLNINVQNMIVKVNNDKEKTSTLLAKADKNTASYTTSLADYMKLTSKGIPEVKTEKPKVDKTVYSNIGSTLISESNYLEQYDNNEVLNPSYNSSEIGKSAINGVRALAGKAEYSIQTVIGKSNTNKIVDTVYYSDQNNIEDTVHVFKLKNNKLVKKYQVDTSIKTDENNNNVSSINKYSQSEPINIYTPISVSAKLTSNSNELVDQTVIDDNKEELQILQINTPFKIELENNNGVDAYKDVQDTFKYSDGYYVKFDFDVHKVKLNGKLYKNGARIPAGTWIGIINKRSNGKLSYIEAQAYGNTEDDKVDVITEEKHSYTVRSVAYNATATMKYRSINFKTLDAMKDEMKEINNICTPKSYFAEETYDVVILNRAYEFRVTDVKDVNWKNVFRKSTGNTNAHTGIVYYSGTTKWNTKSEKSNDIISRTVSEIGRNPLRTLPVGPYKNSNSTYIKAPKIGYRFSFDLKVTGSYYDSEGKPNTNKNVSIGTRFYYLSKDGKTFLKEYNGSGKGIYLFYKKSDGSYVRIDQNGGNYELSFTPNDGYRLIEDYDKSNLSKKSLTLGNLRNITLTSKMATPANNGSYITYYGDYKLPNSTIAVEVDENGKYNINKPLKNGYIGVVFDITIFAGKINDNSTMILSYSKDTEKNNENKTIPNTSQWDYEGYLGYTKIGKALTEDNKIKIKLENGNFVIDTNTMYNDIKGTVILYDIDERAATDFD